MNAQNVWVRLRRRERVRERTKSISSLGPSISIETNLFRSINIYPILFSHLIAGHVSWLRVASTTNGAGEYEIFTVCCHNKIAVKSIWMRTMEITISGSRRSSESFAPRLKRILRYMQPVAQCVSNRMRFESDCCHFAILFAQNLCVHFDISHLCERSKWSQSNARCIFYAAPQTATKNKLPNGGEKQASKYGEIETLIGYEYCHTKIHK